MRKSLATLLASLLLLVSILPAVSPSSLQTAAAYAPPLPTVQEQPTDEAGTEDQPAHLTPTLGGLPAEAEEARARQAIEAALSKYLHYWGPRYQVTTVDVAIEGEWAHCAAEWQGEARLLQAPIHVIAHRSVAGTWQALLPATEGLYLRWVDLAPEGLLPAGQKDLLRAQAAEAQALWPSLPVPQVPPPTTASPAKEPRPGEPPATPVPRVMQAGPQSWTAGTTSVTRLGDQERRKLLGVPQEVIEWERLQASSQVPGLQAYGYPTSIDWRNINGEDWTTGIRNQAGCGSCVAFGTVGAIESRLEIASGNPNLAPDLAEAHMFYCGCGTCCDVGWWPDAAMNFARDTGIVDEACYPYADHDQPCTPCADWTSRTTKITGWSGTTNPAAMKQALADYGPFEATMTVYEDFFGYLGGIYHHTSGELAGGHAITIVGYDDIGGYWIAKNSWGTGWGEDRYGNPYGGWFRIAYGECGIDDYAYIPNVVSSCSAPILVSPSNGYVHESPDRTIAFEWSPPANCTPDGYTFRVSTSSSMDIVPGLPDSSEGGTSTVEMFGSEWDNTDLYWSVRACKPCNPYNPGPWAPPRRFRLEPGESDYPIRLHSDSGYSGGGLYFPNVAYGSWNLGDYDFDDIASSIGIDAGWSARLWRDANLLPSNCYKCLTSSDADFAGDHFDGGCGVSLNDQASSIEVFHNTSCTSPDDYPSPPALLNPPDGSWFDEGQSIDLSWSATGDEYLGEVWGGPDGPISFGWQSETWKYLASLWGGYTYSWRVKAGNSAGESDWSSIKGFTVRPAAPTDLTAQAASCSQVNLYWSDKSASEEGFRIYRGGLPVGQVGANVTSYSDAGLSQNTTYSYTVRGYRDGIESNESNTFQITTPPCPSAQPDLMPSQWDGWQYPVVPSSIPETMVVNTLYAGQPTYIDWGLTNAGALNSGGNTVADLYIDDVRIGRYDFGDVLAYQTWGFLDWVAIVNTPGWHTLKSVADPEDYIDESNETNNVFARAFYWVPTAPYADDMESGIKDWTATGLWHQVDPTSAYHDSKSGSHSWWYGQESTGTYDTGDANSGDLISSPIYIPSAGYYLRFWHRYETETSAQDYDQRWVQISVDGEPFLNVLQLYGDLMNCWQQSPVIDLSGYAGHTIQVRFHFDTVDDLFNDYRGWYIDDFQISATPPPDCIDSHEPNGAAYEATAMSYGQSMTADICPAGDYDFYSFLASAGDRIVIDIDAAVDGSLLDSYVTLLHSDGTTVLAENDDEASLELDSKLGYSGLPHDGTYYIQVRAWGHPLDGGPERFYTLRLFKDHLGPSEVSMPSPLPGDWLGTTMQTIVVTAVDNESGVQCIDFYWQGSDWTDAVASWLGSDINGNDGWSLDWDSSTVAEQTGISVLAVARDWAGNMGSSTTWPLGMDRTSPVVAAGVEPMYDDAPFRDFWVTWWDSWDNLSGIESYDIQYRDGGNGTWTVLLAGTTDTHTRFVGVEDHTYYFRVRATDQAGNQSAYATDGDVQYTVTVCPISADGYESDNTYSAARWIVTDGSLQTHNMHSADDEDWQKFYATAGVSYTLATINTGGHADTVLYLYDTDGRTLIGENDDAPDTRLASRLDWQPASSGVYYARVEHWDPWAYGCTTEYGLSILTDDQTPPGGSVAINNGATYANTTSVTLNLAGVDAGTGVGQVLVSNNPSFAGATWVAYAASLDWALASGEGTKTVYVRFRDRAGNESAVTTDTIVLDTTVPTGSILIEGGAETVTDRDVVLTLAANDAHGVTQMRLCNDAESWGAWEAFAPTRAWALPAGRGEHTVSVQFGDTAGNISAAYSDSVVYKSPYQAHLPLIMRD